MEQDIADLKRHLMEVQSQLAFQEDTVQALNDALALQQQEILLLRRQVELLKQQQEEEQAARHDGEEAGVIPDEKPPHY